MAIFNSDKNRTKRLKRKDFSNEKALQNFVEKNLDIFFRIEFLATEYATSQKHGGRIDTLGIDENGSPVIIEYKWGEEKTIINQGLFYLDWLVDHKGDFQVLVQDKLGSDVEIDYSSPRLVLIAESFSKYDQYAINRMAENIELWAYSKYDNDIFELRLVASSQAGKSSSKKQITKVDYDKYKVETHLKGKSEKIKELFKELQSSILSLETDQEIKENPRKKYIAYATSKNFVELQIQTSQIKLWIDLEKKELDDPKDLVRNVKSVGHYGTGDSEVILKDFDSLDYVVDLIKQSYLQSV
jgi:predicted transport protein